MRISREQLLAEAAATGFRPEVLEKAVHLLNLLEGFRSHPFLKDRLALKGGTALNLFIFQLPRLSVDLDMNYIGAADREGMLAERPKVEEAVNAVCRREGFTPRHVPDDHAGGKWRLHYESALGPGGNLELDLNFMFRVPLWSVVAQDSRPLGSYRASRIPVLDGNEVAAGKLAALLARHASRDLFDAHQLLRRGSLDPDRLRVAFVIYGATNRKDWRTVSVKDVSFEASEVKNLLLPLLRNEVVAQVGPVTTWAARMAEECRQGLGIVLPLNDPEREFLDRLLDYGEIEPSLLTQDIELADRIRRSPGLEWKALNVRRFKGTGGSAPAAS